MDRTEMERLAKLGFDDFRARASDPALNRYQKIGALEEFRRGKEEAIFEDVVAKLAPMRERERRVLDIGCGCSDLPHLLIDWCQSRSHELVLLDSPEMLALLPDGPGVVKVPARFPDCPDLLRAEAGRFDAILVYSVFQSVFHEANAWAFLDRALSLLAPGGAMLVGDIPNVSKRRRFFASEAGIRFHKAFMQTDEAPKVEFNRLEPDAIDDSVVLSILMRTRAQGFDAYLLPQPGELPMSNRREDVLVVRP